MARARNIKPAFFDNDLLADNDPLGRILFIGMWTIADFRGSFEWREKRIKAKLLPFDNCDIKKLAINLDETGFIRFYSDGNKMFCNIKNFVKHQNPHKNERDKGSDIPGYSEEARQVIDLKELTINPDKNGINLDDSASDRADSLILNPDSLTLIPETPNPIKPLSAKADDNTVEVFDYWVATMNKPRSTLNPKITKVIKARLKEGYLVNDLKEAIHGALSDPWIMGTDPQSTKDYKTLTTILRDGAQLERLRDLQPVIQPKKQSVRDVFESMNEQSTDIDQDDSLIDGQYLIGN